MVTKKVSLLQPIPATNTRRGSQDVVQFLVVLAVAACALVVLYKVRNALPDMSIPTHSVPKDNGFNYFVRAANMAPQGPNGGPYSGVRPLNDWTSADLRAWYAKAQPAVRMLQEGLARPCVHPAIRSSDPPFATYSALRESARTLTGAAYVFERSGQPAKAADLLLDCMEMGTRIANHGPFVAAITGSALSALAVPDLERLLPHLSTGELEHVSKRLDGIRARTVTWKQAIQEDEWMVLASYRSMLQKSSPLDLYRQRANVTEAQTGDSLQGMQDGLAFMFANKAEALRQIQANYRAILKTADAPYSTEAPPGVSATIFGEPSVIRPRARRPFAYRDAEMEILRSHVAILRYRKSAGAYPPRIQALVPQYLASVPIDPFGGPRRPALRYRLTSTGFVLYSLGPNMKDDGGQFRGTLGYYRGGDLVANHLARRFGYEYSGDPRRLDGRR